MNSVRPIRNCVSRALLAGAQLIITLCILAAASFAQTPATPGTAVVNIGGPGLQFISFQDQGIIWDNGTAWITINGTDQELVTYDTHDITNNWNQVAMDLASQINLHSPFVTAVASPTGPSNSGPCVILTSRTPGSSGNYSFTSGSTFSSAGFTDDTGFHPFFTQPSYVLTPAAGQLAGGLDAGQVGNLFPKYIVLSVMYAPPGSKSLVNYSNTQILGTTVTNNDSVAAGNAVSVTIGGGGGIFALNDKFEVTASTSFTQEQDSNSSVALTSTTVSDLKVPGPLTTPDGVDHDFDVFVLWLNPVLGFATSPANPSLLTWQGYTWDPADPVNGMDIQTITAKELKNPSLISNGVASAFLRSWARTNLDGTGPALTTTDFAQILAQDPFAAVTPPTTIDPVRYTPVGGRTFPYEPPPPGGQPTTADFSLAKQQTTVQGSGAKTSYSASFSVQNSGTVNFIVASATVTVKDTLNWTYSHQSTQSNSLGVGQSASFTLTGPSTGYEGCTDIQAYQDVVFGTFMFACVNEPTYNLTVTPSAQGTSPGGTTTYTVSTSLIGNFTGTIQLSAIGQPPGATVSFNPPNIIGAGSSTMTVTTSSTTPTGSFPITVGGDSSTPTIAGIRRNQIVNLNVADFSLNVLPSSQTIVAGGNGNFTVTSSALGSFNSNVAVSVTGLPGGATATPSANPIVGGVGSTIFNIVTATTTIPGTYPVTFTGTGGGASHTVSATLIITAPDFTITPTPGSQTVTPGASTTYTISTTALNGFAGNVALSLTGLPAGSTATFAPASISVSGTSTLTVTTSSSTAGGTYTLTITGRSGILSHSTAVNLVVNATPDFSVAVTPQSAGISVGGTASFTVSTAAVNGFSGNVVFTVAGAPAGTTITFNPPSVTGAGSSTLTLVTSAATPVGSFILTISGTSGTLSRNAIATLTVNAAPPDFSIAASPNSQSVTAGSSALYTISSTPLNGFGGTIALTITGLPTGATASFAPTAISGNATSALTITTSPSTPAGTYTLMVTGTSGAPNHSTAVALVVNSAQNFSVTATPASQTVAAGSNTSFTFSIAALNGFTGSVALAATGLPTGVTASFAPTSVATSGNSVMTLTTPANLAAGSYPITVNATSGALSHSTNVTLIVTAQPPDFTLTATPSNLTITRGASGNYTVSIGAVNGFTGLVNLSVTGLPARTAATSTPASVSGAGSATIQISSQNNVARGTSTITITGTSGTLVHSVPVTLTIQ